MKKLMKLTQEANRLWVQQFGKKQKAIDYSGREIMKAAYNDRNSNYGWNIDHILPLSKGGKTVDYNLVCCHILTNNEKADKFPCFKANAKEFEIKKRQKHYVIIARNTEQKKSDDKIINFMDVTQGLKCWKQCETRVGNVFTGYVKVRVEVETAKDADSLFGKYAVFLSELFRTDCIFAEKNDMGYLNYYSVMFKNDRTCIFTLVVGNISTKEDTQRLLDDCVILNTYNNYFARKEDFKSIQIACGMKCYENYFKMSLKCKEDIINTRVQFGSSLIIDELIKINTSAEKGLKNVIPQFGFYPYNFIFEKLEKKLLERI